MHGNHNKAAHIFILGIKSMHCTFILKKKKPSVATFISLKIQNWGALIKQLYSPLGQNMPHLDMSQVSGAHPATYHR